MMGPSSGKGRNPSITLWVFCFRPFQAKVEIVRPFGPYLLGLRTSLKGEIGFRHKRLLPKVAVRLTNTKGFGSNSAKWSKAMITF
jgi:hypothetical protein